ncbi:MAG: phage holin family protein [Myxococcaceae bacterium]
MASSKHTDEAPGVTDLMARLVDGLGELLAQHVALARLELGDEVRSVSRVLATLALVTPLLVVGYALLCLALAFALSPWLSLPGAVALVGAANLAGGGAGLWAVRRTLKRPHLAETTETLRESTTALLTEAREVRGVH